MKERISATIEPETKKKINSIMEKGRFRNISHVIEEAIEVLDKEVKNVKK
jgi:Arc/MetJ-type ribon-helix-helix transcriptional regulator